MRHVFGGRAAAVVAVLALAPLAGCGQKSHSSAPPSSAGAPTTTATRTLTGKAHVTGTVTLMKAAAASFDPIPTPFTLTVPDAGRGGLDLPQAVVDGAVYAIVWSGGRPLPVTGTCKLDASPAPTTVDAAGAHIALDGGVRSFTAGSCAFGSSVAVGSNGISKPVASVQFSLPKDSDFTTSGGAAVTVPAGRRYEGRNGGLQLTGPLHVVTEDDEFDAASVALAAGTWVVTVTSSGNPAVLHVVADLEGNIRTA
jgi:predicted small lipoprotein YifL